MTLPGSNDTRSDLQPFTEPQTRQLHILATKGFHLRVVWRDEDKLHIVVAGRDPSNARIFGLISPRGVFKADLIDFSPAMVGVSAPPEHLTVEEATT